MPIMHCLARIRPLHKATGTRLDIHLASASLKEITGLNGVVWEPAMVSAPVLNMRVFNGDFQAAVEPGSASLPINMHALKLSYPLADACAWSAAHVDIWAGEAGQAWPWPQVFSGKVAGWDRKGQVLSLTAETTFEDKNVLTATYAGTGGIEGGADLKGRVKPLALGWPQNVEPVLINAVDSVYQFSAYGPIEQVTKLYERGADFGAAVADYADYAALVAATIAPGKWATCLAQGLVRLGAPAYGVITGDIKGHKVGASAPRLTGALINALATISGTSTGSIETASLAALDAAAPYPVSAMITDQVKFSDAAKGLALPCNWQAGISLLSKFFVMPVTLSGAAALTLDAQGRSDPQVIESAERDVGPPYYKTIMGAARAWRVHTADEIAFQAPLIPRGDYSASEIYREGNWVTSPDGSTWVYINTAAASGNAPPTWPTTSNAYWANLTAPSTSAVVASLTNESVVLAASSDGVVSSFTPAAGNMVLTLGGASLTTGVTYSVVSAAGVTIAINSSTGAYTVSAMSADTGTATLRATWDGKTFDKVYSIAKSRIGLPGGNGVNGADGASFAAVYLYKRATSTPALPTTTSTFTFATGVLTGQNNGWTQTIPSGTDPIYVTTAAAVSSTATDTIPAGEWAAPTVLAQNGSPGTNGVNGLNNATVFLYRRAASTPALPSTTATYTFATGVLTGHNNSWTQTVPAGTDPVYVTAAVASSNTATDTIAAAEWAAPTILAQNGTNGAPGAPGTDGVTYYTWIAFADNAAGTLNFTTGAPGGRTFIGIAANKTSATEGTNPADYTWSAYAGPPSFGLVAGSANVQIAGGKVYCTSTPGGSWTEQAYSSESYVRGAYVAFTDGGAGGAYMVGLNSDPTTGTAWEQVDFGIYPQSGTGQVVIVNSGSFAYTSATGFWTSGARFAIQYDGKTVSYTKNGVQFYSQSASAGLRLWVDSSFANTSSSLPLFTITAFSAAGSAGNDGSAGADGLSIAATKPIMSIACSANGTPKSGELPRTTQMIVYAGNTDVTSSATYSRTESNCTVTNAGGGAFTATAVAADGAYFDVTASYGGKSITMRITLPKIRDGSAAASQAGAVTINNTSGYTGTQGGPFTLPVGPNGTIYLNATVSYSVSSSSATLYGKWQYRTTPGSGGWTDVASETTGDTAIVGEPGALTVSSTLSGPGTAANWEFQFVNRKVGGGTASVSGDASAQVSWS